MTEERIKIGKKGESEAVKYLKNNGYEIIDRNFQKRYGEIDIVAQKNKELVFVEVRSKTGFEFGLPEETVGKEKKRRLMKNVKYYLKYNDFGLPYRIDVIGIVFNKNKEVERLKHYKNVTLF